MKINIDSPNAFGSFGQLVPSSSSPVAGSLVAADALAGIISGVSEYFKTKEIEETKRAAISARKEIELSKIRLQQKNLSKAIKYTFAERALVLEKQFECLDKAIAHGDAATVKASLDAMVSLVQSSPFQKIQEMQRILGSEDFVIRLE